MDFIERWFGWSPDGGDGGLEILIVLAACVAFCLLAYRLSPRLQASAERLLDRLRRTRAEARD